MIRKVWVLVVSLVIVLGIGTLGSAQQITRSNWVPNVGQLFFDEQPLGDLWTFVCPAGGTVTASVDTKDDQDNGQANIDPFLLLHSGSGRLIAFGNDDLDCSHLPVCGFRCPAVRAPCGATNPHSLLVRDFGGATKNGAQCAGGGGYELTVQVFRADGSPVDAARVQLGGGPTRRVPAWALEEGKAPVGPALDDEAIPRSRAEFPEPK